MIIYEDVFTGHELFSDAYPTKLIDDLFFESNGQVITIDNSVDDSALGGNASAEAEEEGGADDVKETAINLIYAFKLQKYEMDSKAYKKHAAGYGKKLIKAVTESGATPEEISAFKAKLQAKILAIIKNFADYDVYINEDYNEEGMLPLLNYREDGVTPYFTYFQAGVKGVKC
jgi:hypothetical protein